MGTRHELGEPVEAGSGLRRVRLRVLLAHDASAVTCDPLIEALEAAFGSVDVSESPSVHDAFDAVRASIVDLDAPELGATGARFDVCLVCLDLPPAPLGGVRFAQEALRRGLPVVLVTRSLRWIPATAAALRELPWVTPEAGADEVARAVESAVGSFTAAELDAQAAHAASG